MALGRWFLAGLWRRKVGLTVVVLEVESFLVLVLTDMVVLAATFAVVGLVINVVFGRPSRSSGRRSRWRWSSFSPRGSGVRRGSWRS